MKKEKIFPPIGMRIIKSAVGVFLCYLVNILRGDEGIVFYSQLAVLWCMQDYISETKEKASQRAIGTAFGAVYGLVALLLFSNIPHAKIIEKLTWSEPLLVLMDGLIVSVFIVLVLYTTVILKKKQASYFSCVVFLSIVVNHMSDVNPYLFVWNRFLDTFIGILLGVLVNCFSLPHKRQTEILFLSGVDDTLLNKNNNMTAFERVELNRMIENGANFSVSTMRTPASIRESIGDITLKLPTIVMDGAAMYNFKEKRYEKVYVISAKLCEKIAGFMEVYGIAYFTNIIVDDVLLIYYSESTNKVYNSIVEKLRSSPYRNYVKRPWPKDEDVVYFMTIDRTVVINDLYERMSAAGLFENLKVLKYESTDYLGYSYLKIYNHNATRENMLAYFLEEHPFDKVVTFGTIPNRYTHVIEEGDSNRVVRLMKKDFYA